MASWSGINYSLFRALGEFAEVRFSDYITEYTPNAYIYQDLTVDYVFKLYENSSPLSQYSPLTLNVPLRKARARLARALEVNRTCAGRFTMSQWLADYLVNEAGMPPERVHHVGGGCNIDTSRIDSSRRNGNRFLFSCILSARTKFPVKQKA